MGIRSKQIDMEELRSELDQYYSSVAKTITLTISSESWTKPTGQLYYSQQIAIADMKESSKLFVGPKFSIVKSYEDNLKNENLFSSLVRVTSIDGAIVFYSDRAIAEPFEVSVMYFN